MDRLPRSDRVRVARLARVRPTRVRKFGPSPSVLPPFSVFLTSLPRHFRCPIWAVALQASTCCLLALANYGALGDAVTFQYFTVYDQKRLGGSGGSRTENGGPGHLGHPQSIECASRESNEQQLDRSKVCSFELCGWRIKRPTIAEQHVCGGGQRRQF